jgi:hypothetical protein
MDATPDEPTSVSQACRIEADTLAHNIRAWAIREAAAILSRSGPQSFDRVALWVTAAAEDAFHGGHGLSMRRLVRPALIEAARTRRFHTTWRYSTNENRDVPHAISADAARRSSR